MCGIAGIFEKNQDNKELVSRMLDAIRHRGPDDKSIHVSGDFTLGHRRLSIIDLDTGNQPIFNEDGSVAVILNGEIYNYRELRREMEARGHRFYTRSDTEVIVHLYEEYDTRFVQRLNGIFALALLDNRRGRLVLARDHFGVKPLHYYIKEGVLVFASEQKSILLHPKFTPRLNHEALHLHLNLRYTQGDQTLLRDVRRLPPAHFAVFENGLFSLHRYWQLRPRADRSVTEGEAADRLNELLKQAVKRQVVSDVPIGVYLSGGLDSSAIVQKMSELGIDEINTFTLGFNEPTDEFEDARRVADFFHTRHHATTLALDPLRQLPAAIWHAEEPKINLLQGYNLSAFVHPVTKVILGGVGGDELFAGYDIHRFIYPFNRWHDRVPRPLLRLLRWKADFVFRLQQGAGGMRHDEYRRGVQMLCAMGDIERYYLILRNVWDHDAAFYKQVYAPGFLRDVAGAVPRVAEAFHQLFSQAVGTPLDRVAAVELQSKMVNDYLLVEDRVSMAHSVEERVPFLDLDLVEFAFNLPIELKIKHNTTKYLLRRALAPRLPPEIIHKKKRGFAANPYLQFKKDLREVATHILTPERLRDQGIFNPDYIRRILDHPPHPRLRWHYNHLWILVGLAIWEEQFLRGRVEEHIEAYYR
jgi:asparagine synthase (glutamine-hydrolysing)